MNVKRWAMVTVLGIASGAIWATGYSDWGPSWVTALRPPLADGIMLVPLAVIFAGAAALVWWRWPAASVYGAIVVVSVAVGIVRDEKAFGCSCCVGESWSRMLPESVFGAVIFGGPFVAAAWGAGRLLRKGIARWAQSGG